MRLETQQKLEQHLGNLNFDLNNVYNGWKNIILEEEKKDYMILLKESIEFDYSEGIVLYPSFDKIFEAFRYFDINDTKVVILGMDPYINEGQAMGLSFSVPKNQKIPPSLKNIYKEIETDLGIDMKHRSGDLTDWAKQGVLLLNSILTVQKGHSGSNKDIGWQKLTDAIISKLNEMDKPLVFMLWGNFAKSKGVLLNNPKHLVLQSGHPSPYSSHLFFGNHHFGKTNDFLVKNGEKQIDWIGEK